MDNRSVFLQMEMSSLLVNKTPISLLQEWLNPHGITPRYELLQEDLGAAHVYNHSFCFRVSVGNITALGSGRSKKEAKHAAARTLLNMLLDGPFSKQQANFTDLENDILDNAACANNDTYHNPVGKLQEICTARSWAHPHYMLVSEQGPPHDRIFSICVEVRNMKKTGTGRSKRLAKREAAIKMLHQLSIQLVEDESDFYFDGDQINGFHINYTQILEDIATQQKIQILYQDIEDKSPSGLFQCIVRISTWPIIVCCGQGATPKLAVNNASMHALDCLTIITKKCY